MRKVNKYAIIIMSISLFIVVSIFLGTSKQREAKREFSKKFETYYAVKESLIEELQRSNSEKKIFYPNGTLFDYTIQKGNTIEDEELLNNLNLLSEVTTSSFDWCRVFNRNGYQLVTFVYDWEQAFDKTYNIYYCESLEVLKSHVSEGEFSSSYTIKKLKDNWYYVVYN